MLKLVIANKAYSSWSLRGWLAVKQAGLPFEEVLIPMDSAAFAAAKSNPVLMPSGKVPALHDGDIAVWESLAIIDFLADRVGRDRYWPSGEAARAFARSIASEMHAGFMPLRRECPMNLLARTERHILSADALADVRRIETLWARARRDFGQDGDYLFGAFGAADIMFSAVATRFDSYGVTLGGTAGDYCAALLAHPWIQDWYAAARAESESWRLPRIDDVMAH